MTVQICSCKGLNSKCEKCFGSGYENSPTLEKTVSNQKEKKSVEKNKLKSVNNLPENIKSLEKTEVQKILLDIITLLDYKSKKQMQLLNSIPFSLITFRRDFKEKFAGLSILEDEKIVLREQLFVIETELISQKISGNFRFKHFLSDKDIDVDSNRQLKDLIKEYKRLKN